jgi:response regulator RpfG family c-di-GMP phosphodiesterase
MSDIREYLRRNELFADLDQAVLDQIASRMQPVVYEAGVAIFKEGETGDKMFIITSGEAAVVKEMGWGKRELRRMGTGEVFGEMALITHAKRTATIRTLTPTECLQLHQQDFQDLMNRDPHFAQCVARSQTKRLQDSDERTTQDLLQSYQLLMFAVAKLADSRDPETGAHLTRTRNYCALLAEHLSTHPQYRSMIYPGFIQSIYDVSPLHDIGKVAIKDCLLLKPGGLTEDEYEIMKTHTLRGAETLQAVEQRKDLEIFRMAYRICRFHHEKWNGTGYPDRLAGEAIPIEARIMALADVYDALLSKRAYKPPMSYQATREEIRRSAGTFFDPEMTQVMLDHIGEYEDVHEKTLES